MTDETTDPERETFIPFDATRQILTSGPEEPETLLSDEEVTLIGQFGHMSDTDIRAIEMFVVMKLNARFPRRVFTMTGGSW